MGGKNEGETEKNRKGGRERGRFFPIRNASHVPCVQFHFIAGTMGGINMNEGRKGLGRVDVKMH